LKKLIFLLVFILFWGIIPVDAWEFDPEGKKIDEILILGTNRLDQETIKKQLPFTFGDYWTEDFQRWTVRRLNMLDFFSYNPFLAGKLANLPFEQSPHP